MDCPEFVRSSIAGAAGYKLFTLAIVVHNDGRLLLGEKKRGFGAGYFNGFGGKVEAGETVEQAARRELLEEACITATDIAPLGRLFFVFDTAVETPWEVHVFCVRAYEGDPQETEEMRPQWFAPQDIPFHQMWADDAFWYPLFMRGACFAGLFGFTNTTQMLWHRLEVALRWDELSARDLLPSLEEPQYGTSAREERRTQCGALGVPDSKHRACPT